MQVKSWRAHQASHRLEGPIYLRRNFSPHFVTLENWLANQVRQACSGLMVAELVGGFFRPYISTTAQDRLTEGDKMSLAEMVAKEVRVLNLHGTDRRMGRVCVCTNYPRELVLQLNRVCWCLLLTVLCGMSQIEIERIGKRINTDVCSNLHPATPCRFWQHTWGAVPEAVTSLPYNYTVLRTDLFKWPASASGKLNTC